jgi:hypothetical protein
MIVFYHSLSCVCSGCLREDMISIGCGGSDGVTEIAFVTMTVRTGQP